MGEGYRLRVPGDQGVLLSRRRLVQYVNLGVYGILPPKDAVELQRRPEDGQLQVVTSMRLRHEFGDYLTDSSASQRLRITEVDDRQIDLLYGYLEGRQIGRWVDFKLGRQFEMSGLDWYVFDGGWLRVRTPAKFGVEVFGGFAVDGTALFGYPTFELDGTSQTPADRARSPMIGAAISTNPGLKWVDARIAYRRQGSPAVVNADIETEDGTGLATGADQELISAAVALRLVDGKVSPDASARYNLGTGRLDDVNVGIRWNITSMHMVRAHYLRTLPSFDLDSIFNVFSATAFEDARLVYQVKPAPRVTLLARGQMRFFRGSETASGVDPGGLTLGGGGGAAIAYRGRRISMRADGFGLSGTGGLRYGGSIESRFNAVWDRLSIDGRAYFVSYADEQVAERRGYGLSFQAGLNMQLFKGIHVSLVGEEMITTYLTTAFRAWAMFTADWSFRVGRR